MAYIALKRGGAPAVSGITENLEFRKDSGCCRFQTADKALGKKSVQNFLKGAKLIAFFLTPWFYKFSKCANRSLPSFNMLLRIDTKVDK